MCGRYAASKDTAELVEELDIELDATGEPSRSLLVHPQTPPAGTPDWNMAPTKQAPVVLTRAPRGAPSAVDGDAASTSASVPVRQLRLLTWGLVPSWAEDAKAGIRMINARAESLLDKPGFKRAAVSRRCLVPAQGWYEWQVSPVATDARGKPRKQPFFMHRVDGGVVALAGLYEFWRDPQVVSDTDPDAWLTTFTIITTEAEPGLDRIHDRQPLVLDRDDWAPWLDPGTTDVDTVRALLLPGGPRREGRFDAYPVSSAVSATRNNGEQLLLPLPREELHGAVDPVTGEVVGA